MGTWGYATFDDDDALDWVAELEDHGTDAISDALTQIGAVDGYMDTSIGSCALSACEVVAALAGRPSEELTAEVLAWVDEHGDIDVIPFRAIAIRAVDLLMGENSELHDRWQESDGYTTWSARVMDLKRRLESIAEK